MHPSVQSFNKCNFPNHGLSLGKPCILIAPPALFPLVRAKAKSCLLGYEIPKFL